VRAQHAVGTPVSAVVERSNLGFFEQRRKTIGIVYFVQAAAIVLPRDPVARRERAGGAGPGEEVGVAEALRCVPAIELDVARRRNMDDRQLAIVPGMTSENRVRIVVASQSDALEVAFQVREHIACTLVAAGGCSHRAQR
jgi:hypothetical protein